MDLKKYLALVIMLCLSLALSPAAFGRKKAAKTKPANSQSAQPAPQPAQPNTQTAQPASQPAQAGGAVAQNTAGPGSAVQNRVRDLIALIESQPTGLIVNNNARVASPPSNEPFTEDGSRNQNFKMVPDLSGNQTVLAGNMDQRRAQAVQELISIGKPAVDQLAVALAADYNHYRNFYAYALGEIKDPRAVPALIKYMEDGKAKLSMVASVRASGNAAMAAQLEQQGTRMCSDASIALQKITGQNYGEDVPKWQTWWNANKEKVGPTPKLTQYTANPPAPAVHYDPSLLKNPTYPSNPGSSSPPSP